MIVDTHAHVFARGLSAAPDARYVPAYDATVRRYLAILDAQGVDAGVLVQPSFLGADNRHLLQALAQAPQRLRGVAVVAPGADEAELAALHAGGVRGIRINPFERARPDLSSAGWRATLERAAALGWHVVLHEQGEALIDLLAQVDGYPGPLVVDHLGRPGADDALDAAVERAVLRRAAERPLYVKLSAPYRSDAAAAARAARRYRQALGPGRLLWGSDWPWPNFEDRVRYGSLLGWLNEVLPDAGDRAAVHAAAASLYGFPRAAP